MDIVLCLNHRKMRIRKIANDLLPYALKDLSQNLPVWKKQAYTRTGVKEDFIVYRPPYKTVYKTFKVAAGEYYLLISDLLNKLPKID